MNIYGAIEAGGTKIICASATIDGKILNRIQIPTKTPEVTIPKIIEFFQKESINNNLKAIGIGTFGPADVDPSLKTFGMIRSTPKQGLKDFDFISSKGSLFFKCEPLIRDSSGNISSE